MANDFPPDFPTPTRDEILQDYLRDVRFASDGEQGTGEGTQPFIDGSVIADALVPAYLDLYRAAQSLALSEATGEAVNAWARSLGQPERQPATPSTGSIVVQTAQGGTTVFAGDELKTSGGLRFRVLAGKAVKSGGLVSVQSIDAGPSTNLTAGTRLTWTSPRPGCLPDATIWGDADGRGLVGGRLAESDAEVKQRLRDVLADPPSAGNDAHVRELVRRAGRALGIPVQASFTYPAILGPGTTAIVFTLLPAHLGGSRSPTGAQVAAVEAWIKEQLPGDDTTLVGLITPQDIAIALKVAWREGAKAWTDLQPWPPIYPGNGAILVRSVTSATEFSVGRATSVYTGVPKPKAGQTIALYNQEARAFVRKRILTVSGTGPWNIMVDTTANVSDVAYVPVALQRVSPWSDSLALAVPPVLAEFDRLGPGEQVATFFDPGRRQRRQPVPQVTWDSRIGSRVINGVQDLAAVLDAQLVDPTQANLPMAPTVGTPGVNAWMFALRDLAVGAL